MNVFHENSLYKKKILVTGASSGIGLKLPNNLRVVGQNYFY